MLPRSYEMPQRNVFSRMYSNDHLTKVDLSKTLHLSLYVSLKAADNGSELTMLFVTVSSLVLFILHYSLVSISAALSQTLSSMQTGPSH